MVFLITPFQCSIALAEKQTFGVGVSYMYADIKDRHFDFVDKYKLIKDFKEQFRTINFTYSIYYDKGFNVALSTNRPFNDKIKRVVKRKSDGLVFQNETKTVIDSLNVAYRIYRFNYGVVLANVNMDKHLYHKGEMVGYDNEYAIVGGFSLGYFISRKVLSSITYILPSESLDLEGALSFNVNFLF